tara:strand:+ start:102 stop:1130 length:1029 start_codon:yes stop_codon:yes gene_type:complete
MIEILRKYIINKRTKVLLKQKAKKSLFLNDELFYSIKSLGKKNKNKIFYVINRSPGGGMFSNLNFIIHHLLVAEKFDFIPIIDMENFPTIYNEKKKINNSFNAWDYYFEKINKYKLKDVYKSKNVIFTNKLTNKNFYFDGFERLTSQHFQIVQKYIKINKDIIQESKNYVKKNFKNKKILGVHFRGSDQKTQERHPLPATVKQMESKINELMKKKKFHKFFLITEEKKYLDYFKKKMGKKILYCDSYISNNSDIFNDNQSNRNLHRYKIGRENILNMLCLRSTNHILYVSSNLADAAIFFSNKKIPKTKIDNGFNSNNIFIAQILWYIKKLIPSFLGGFKIK